NTRVELELLERLDVVVPVQRLFEPGDVEVVQVIGCADGGRQIPALIDVEHQLDIGAERLANRFDAVVVVFDGDAAADAADFELDGVDALVDVALDLLDQLGNAFPFAIVTAGDVDRNRIAITAQELVYREAGGLGH